MDAGHGGDDLGAVGYKGFMEKDIALALTKKVQNHLAQVGVATYMTRKDDEQMPLAVRAQRALKAQADILVSIHANSAGAAQHGIEALCLPKAPIERGHFFLNTAATGLAQVMDEVIASITARSHRLAHSILGGMVQQTLENDITIKNRGLKCNGWQVLLQCGMPSTIVEAGFLTSTYEGALLIDDAYQTILAYGIAQGITRFLRSEKMM